MSDFYDDCLDELFETVKKKERERVCKEIINEICEIDFYGISNSVQENIKYGIINRIKEIMEKENDKRI